MRPSTPFPSHRGALHPSSIDRLPKYLLNRQHRHAASPTDELSSSQRFKRPWMMVVAFRMGASDNTRQSFSGIPEWDPGGATPPNRASADTSTKYCVPSRLLVSPHNTIRLHPWCRLVRPIPAIASYVPHLHVAHKMILAWLSAYGAK